MELERCYFGLTVIGLSGNGNAMQHDMTESLVLLMVPQTPDENEVT